MLLFLKRSRRCLPTVASHKRCSKTSARCSASSPRLCLVCSSPLVIGLTHIQLYQARGSVGTFFSMCAQLAAQDMQRSKTGKSLFDSGLPPVATAIATFCSYDSHLNALLTYCSPKVHREHKGPDVRALPL